MRTVNIVDYLFLSTLTEDGLIRNSNASPKFDFLHANTISTTVIIAKIKGMPRSLFYDIPCYVTMDYEK